MPRGTHCPPLRPAATCSVRATARGVTAPQPTTARRQAPTSTPTTGAVGAERNKPWRDTAHSHLHDPLPHAHRQGDAAGRTATCVARFGGGQPDTTATAFIAAPRSLRNSRRCQHAAAGSGCTISTTSSSSSSVSRQCLAPHHAASSDQQRQQPQLHQKQRQRVGRAVQGALSRACAR
jgi:hypothetical protein